MSVKRLRCDYCNSDNLRIVFKNIGDYESSIAIKTDILCCGSCQLIQQSDVFTKQEIKNFYLEDYHGRSYLNKTFLSKIALLLRANYYERFITMLQKQIKNKDIRILDYGSGDGFLGYQLYKKGYRNLYSCDFFKPQFNIFKKHIFPEQICEYRDFFDANFMINSIEHLTSFSEQFKIIDKAMKDKSILVIETPNFDSLDSLIFKRYWGGLHQPRHTYLWSKKTLRSHISLWKYEIQSFKSPQSAHWAISCQNYLSDKFIFLKNRIKNGRLPGYLLIVFLFLPITIIQNFLNKESVLNIIAIRKKR